MISFDATSAESAFSGFTKVTSASDAAASGGVYAVKAADGVKALSTVKDVSAYLSDSASGVNLGVNKDLVFVSVAGDGKTANVWYVEGDGTEGIGDGDVITLIGTVTGADIAADSFDVA